MWPFTVQERQAALFAVLVFIAGIAFKLVFWVAPPVNASLQVLDSVRFRPKVDLAKASYSELLTVKGIGPSSAARIINYRKTRGRIRNPAELSRALKKKPRAVRPLIGAFKWP
ncbi:MAG: helix-hairpin-helix domain-containing protein [Candidatus Omnitrophica bacterium]|nr:helix-hairpin-helix domain-containing protein [Candidatus Omnitrophota bacterium]